MPLLGHSGRRSRPSQLLASTALLVGAAALTALALCAGFASASPTANHPRLSVTPRALSRVGALAPGDRAERTLELRYRGTGRFTAVVLELRSRNHSLLNSTKRNGLRLSVERCSKRWTRRGRTKAFACRGRHWSVVTTVHIRGGQRLRLRHLSGRTEHLRLTVSLPRAAGNALQGRIARMVYRFTGVAAQ